MIPMNRAHPDPMDTITRHSTIMNNDLVMGGLERPDFETGDPDVRRFRAQLIRSEKLVCRNLSVEQQITRNQGWFKLQEKIG